MDSSGFDRDQQGALVDRRRRFRRMWDLVPASARPVVEHVVLKDMSLRSIAGCNCGRVEARHLDRLKHGLTTLHAAWKG